MLCMLHFYQQVLVIIQNTRHAEWKRKRCRKIRTLKCAHHKLKMQKGNKQLKSRGIRFLPWNALLWLFWSNKHPSAILLLLHISTLHKLLAPNPTTNTAAPHPHHYPISPTLSCHSTSGQWFPVHSAGSHASQLLYSHTLTALRDMHLTYVWKKFPVLQMLFKALACF